MLLSKALTHNKDDYFKMFYDNLGHPRIKALEYRRSNLEKAYKIVDVVEGSETTIKVYLNLKEDSVISKADLKTKLQDIYDKIKVDRVAKATDIEKWYEVKTTKLNNRPAFKIVKML